MGVYRAVVNFTAAGVSPGVNVWHLRTSTDATATAGKAMAQDAIDKLRNFYGGIAVGMATGAVYKCDGITDVDTDEGVSLNWANITGTGSGALLPTASAVVVGWRTTIHARRGMGRTFLGPPTYSWLDADGTLLAGALTILNTQATTLLNASLLDNGWALGVYGQQDAMPKASSVARAAAPHVLRDFTGFSIKDKFAVMRSRRP